MSRKISQKLTRNQTEMLLWSRDCELVGFFILNQLGPVIDKNDIGLYQDDGLGIFC